MADLLNSAGQLVRMCSIQEQCGNHDGALTLLTYQLGIRLWSARHHGRQLRYVVRPDRQHFGAMLEILLAHAIVLLASPVP